MPRCSACGDANAETARFCQSCGARLDRPPAVAVEARKTVTVLFADVVESTSLLATLQPESARRVLDRYFDTMSRVLESHGGTVEKFIGDAIMAVFGIPRLHEDDALRAVRAAVEMRAALARLNVEFEGTVGVTVQMRVGLDTGRVVARDPANGQAFVTGEPVNVAARLEAAAEPGDVLIGESTYVLVRQSVSTKPIEGLALKGTAGVVGAHRLLAVGERPLARRHESRFVGREPELAELVAEFECVLSARTARLVTVLGTAGVGKSRLVDEFLRTCADTATIIRGRCLPYGEGITFWPLKEAIAEAAGIVGDESAETARARIRALVESATDGDLIVERVAETLGITESVGEHMGHTWAMRRLLEEVARTRPLVLVLDDMQWAEPTFLDLVETLVQATDTAPLLLLCMARPELLEARLSWAGTTDRSRRIFLQPLSVDDTESLLASLLGGAELAEAPRSKIIDAADGLPLFVEEMVAMLIEDGSLRRDDGRWVAVDLDQVAAPATIQALLAARLDQLDPAEQAMLQRGAIEGQVFHRGAVLFLSPEVERAGVDARLSELSHKGLIEPENPEFADDVAYRFHHLLLRDVAYESAHKNDRATHHERFAAWLDEQAGERASEYDEIAGYHLEQACLYAAQLRAGGAPDGEVAERAGTRLGGAGLRAHARGDWSAAASLLSRALALLSGDSEARERLAPKLHTARLEIAPAQGGRFASVRCFTRWPLGHSWALKERHGALRLRCERCGKERHRWSMPEGAPRPPIPGGGGSVE